MTTRLVRNVCKYGNDKSLKLLIPNVSYHKYHCLNSSLRIVATSNYASKRFTSTAPDKTCKNLPPQPPPTPPTLREKLKQAVAQYGTTVVVFHTAISLASLGISYVVVSSGLDVAGIMTYLGINEETVGKIARNAGTFAVAYAIHKMFMPVRLTVTLTVTPFLVRYLRRVGILKKPKTVVKQTENKDKTVE